MDTNLISWCFKKKKKKKKKNFATSTDETEYFKYYRIY